MDGDPDDLASRVEEFADAVEERGVDPDARRSSGLRDLLRFTERYAIPAAISALEANVRLLERTADAIRRADGRIDDEGRRDEGHRATEERERPGDAALDAAEGALAEFERALRGDPADPDARRLLAEARELRREIRDRTEAARTDRGDGSPRSPDAVAVPVTEEREGSDGADTSEGGADAPEGGMVDVDAELESIKRDLDEAEREPNADSDPDDEDDRDDGRNEDGGDDRGDRDD